MEQLTASAISFSLIYLTATAIYNLYWHPLAKYPGPFLCRISGLPSFYHACMGDRHIWLWQLFQIYGDKIRASPNALLFNTSEAWHSLFDKKTNVRKSGFYEAWMRNKHDINTLSCTDVELHHKKRRLLKLAFTEQSLKAWGPFMARHIDRWNELLPEEKRDEDGWSEPQDLSKWSDFLLFDLLGDLCFGMNFATKEPGENKLKTIPHFIAKHMMINYPIAKSPILDTFLWLKPRGLDKLIELATPKDVKDFFSFVDETVTKRVQMERQRERDKSPAEREDMFHFLCTARDPETGELAFNETDLKSEAHLLIIAGSDTTADLLCAFFFYVTHFPQAYARVVKEIRETFSRPEEIVQGSALLTDCKYLRACLNECFRLAPAGPSELERMVLPGGTNIAGEFLPEGVKLGVVHWALGRNEEFYGGDANVFRPERWIVSDNPAEGTPAEEVKRLRHGLHTFGKGVGDCVGQKVAMLQLSMAIARTLWRFDVRVAERLGEGRPELGWGRRDPNTYMLRDAYIALRKGPILQFKERCV
ncbi:cytochrome P450 [Lentithecium fluviatile CBS 122367]|uniref:Cytochrome P450 n=1 Tax=Lentithecium fluviatile CBS 122367 TaxID=1168545 RepID=A0A6G1IEY5_9PLEO|nr:cytochrome P450 [Lentithecium fluviatile CBS 122367]